MPVKHSPELFDRPPHIVVDADKAAISTVPLKPDVLADTPPRRAAGGPTDHRAPPVAC